MITKYFRDRLSIVCYRLPSIIDFIDCSGPETIELTVQLYHHYEVLSGYLHIKRLNQR